MPTDITPSKFMQVVENGFHRLKRYRSARAMFLKEYVGQYYQQYSGVSADEPINLLFHAVRILVPNLVMKNPYNEVTTDIIPHQVYADLLGMGLNTVQRRMNIKDKLRAWIVSSIFAMGIMKVGLAGSNTVIQFGDHEIDPGEVYAELVDLDNFVFDPTCTSLDRAAFLGDRITVPRTVLLDSGLYKNDLIEKLPSVSESMGKKETKDISQTGNADKIFNDMQDMVHVVQCWIPKADALVTVPDPREYKCNDYLAIQDYYGPDEGPYEILTMTPPVPNNPYPVAPVSIWYDLHRMANRMFKKSMEQADRQKDIGVYDPANIDEAEMIRDSEDGDLVAGNPDTVQVLSFGGQNRDNASMLQQLQTWFNYMAGNPDQLSGMTSDADTATQAAILESNSRVTVQDSKQITYDKTAGLSKKIAWYLHNDPLIDIPLAKRRPGGERVQMRLTPEQREGEFSEFTFAIKAKSMSRIDPMLRSKRIIEFATNLVPGLVNAAMVSMRMGVPFNLQKAITDLAEELDITDYVQDWFVDPEFANRLQLIMAMGPQSQGKATPQTSPAGTRQNQGSPTKRNISSPAEEQNRQQQEIAGLAQKATQGVYRGAY